MKIYFDDVLIVDDYYASLTKSGELFEGNFKLGLTMCEPHTLEVAKEAFTEIPEIVTIYENDVLVKTLYVDEYKENDFTIELSLLDNMVKFNFPYDASQIFVLPEDESEAPEEEEL